MTILSIHSLRNYVETLFPGILIATLIAMAGQFISDHYGAPAMLMALLFGIALNFLSEEGRCVTGIAFSARKVLRFGVALLGMRISIDMAAQLGGDTIILIVGGVCMTIGFGLTISRFFGHGPRFAFLSAGSVAICGASAAIAISAILPRDERTDERLVFTVVGVTLLSTIAMITYPIVGKMLGFDDHTIGIFLGATIHDVAQVVGAGFSISAETGEVATVVKLIRVAMLAPIILLSSIVIRNLPTVNGEGNTTRPPIIPGFVLAFMVLVALNSFHLIPAFIVEASIFLSRWALLTAIAAVGLNTSLREVIKVGGPAIAILVAETLFIALVVIYGLKIMI